MEQTLFDFILNIPLFLSKLGSWLVSPINERFLNISPLALFGVGGVSIFLGIITIHIIKLFV